MKKELTDLKEKLDKLELGRFKIWLSRVQGYLGVFSFILILYGMAIKNNLFGWGWYVWVILLLIGVPLLLLVDIKIICPSELKYGFGLHPKLKEMLTETKKLTEKVDKLIEYHERDIKDKKHK